MMLNDGLKAQMLSVEELNASALFRESASAAREAYSGGRDAR